ncbi:MAG TPA: hypothetical protein V6C81_19325 [Planktothrix sp.]|jgi:hypothetical protein
MAGIVIVTLIIAFIFKPVAAWIILIGWVFDGLVAAAEKAEKERELQALRTEVAALQARLDQAQSQSNGDSSKR